MDIQTMGTPQSPTMPTWAPGEGADAILSELHRRWNDHEPPPAFRDLAALFDVQVGAIQYHVARMRTDGLVWAHSLWLTTAGHARARRLSRRWAAPS